MEDREEEDFYERRRSNHFRLDQEDFNAIVDRAVHQSLIKLEERLFILVGKAIIDKLLFILTIIGGISYAYFTDIFKK